MPDIRPKKILITGATAVQIGTANFINPCTTVEIIDGLEKFCREKNISAIRQIIGTLCLT